MYEVHAALSFALRLEEKCVADLAGDGPSCKARLGNTLAVVRLQRFRDGGQALPNTS
jgi:hypothetical protein